MTDVGVLLLQTLRGLHLFRVDSTANAVLSLLNIRQVYDTPLRLEPLGTCLSAVSAYTKWRDGFVLPLLGERHPCPLSLPTFCDI